MSEQDAKHRQYLNEIAERNVISFDKAILSLSSGALGISIVFIDKISGANGSSYIFMLGLSWLFYLLAILANLWSYLSGARECADEVERLDQKENSEDFSSGSLTVILNYFSFWFFTFGTVALCIFALINMETNNNDRQAQTTITETEAIQ